MKIKELLPVKIYSYTLNNYKNFDQTLLTVEFAIFILSKTYKIISPCDYEQLLFYE